MNRTGKMPLIPVVGVACILFATLTAAPRPAHADCVGEPTASCLVDLALAQVDKVEDADIFRMNGDPLLGRLATIQAASGDLAGAAQTASRIGASYGVDVYGKPMIDVAAQDLLVSGTDFIAKFRPSKTDLAPVRIAAEVFLKAAQAAPPSRRTFSAEAFAVQVLAKVGEAAEAHSHLDKAVERFLKAVDGGDLNVPVAADDLVNAAVALGDTSKAREIVAIVSRDGMDQKGVSPDAPGWTNEMTRSALGRALAEAGDHNGAAQIARSLTDLSGPVSQAIWIARIKSAGVAEAVERVRKMPAETRDGAVYLLVLGLLHSNQLAAAATLAEEVINPGWRDSVRIDVARDFLSAGDVPAAKALLAKVTAVGLSAEVVIQLAMMQAKAGESGEAKRLVNRAKEALTAIGEPAALVTLHTKLAFAFLALDDREGAERSVKAALQHVSGLEGMELLAAIPVAALQTKLGHLEDGVAMLRSVMEGRPEDVSSGRIRSARVLAEEGYLADAQAVLSDALRHMPADASIDALSLAGLYAEAAEVLTMVGRGR